MSKEKRQIIINKIIDATRNEGAVYGNTLYKSASKLYKLNSSNAFKILFELMDIARNIGNKSHRYNIYSYIFIALYSCNFNDNALKLLCKRIFFNIELLDFLYSINKDTLYWIKFNDLIGNDKMCMKTLSKLILKHKKRIFDLSSIVVAFRYNLDDNIIDCILNILLKHVDKQAINDINMLGLINCDRKFTEKQREKINAIKILCTLNN